jgi:hypothetical protein
LIESGARRRPLSRREWILLSIGLLAWLALGAGGVWFVHQVTRAPGSCGAPVDAPTHRAEGTPATPRDAFQAITGQGRCP